ncbi:MAG: DUF4282 domain-containing protein [Chrysiogenia bacterium]
MEEQKSVEKQSGEGFFNFISFKKFLSTLLIQIIYVIGFLYISISGLSTIFEKQRDAFGFSGYNPGNKILMGLLILSVGNLIWRIICEGIIVIFSIHDLLASIEKQLKRNAN